jgi:hypothetical protein
VAANTRASPQALAQGMTEKAALAAATRIFSSESGATAPAWTTPR